MDASFPSASREPRPVRLSPETRRFAFDSLQGRYGREIQATPCLHLEPTPAMRALSPMKLQDAAIRLLAEQSPLRVIPGELVCGSATLSDATTAPVRANVPVRFDGVFPFEPVNHVTFGFEKVLRLGLDEYGRRIARRLADDLTPPEREFVESLDATLASLRIWHGRYLALLRDLAAAPPVAAAPAAPVAAAPAAADAAHARSLLDVLARVPFQPPATFREAVQSLWFVFAFTRLCGNWPGIGRIDEMLGGFLAADLAAGRLDLGGARELLAHFFIKGCEWITGDPTTSGDAQHYQNLILGGVDAAGRSVENDVTFLVLDVVEELGISDFPIALRVGPTTSDRLLRRAAEVMRHGGGIVAVYDEPLVLRALESAGIPRPEAARFCNDGCWEVQVPGATAFTYKAVDGFGLLQNEVLRVGPDAPPDPRAASGGWPADPDAEPPDFPDFEALYAAFVAALRRRIDAFHAWADGYAGSNAPCSVASLFTDDCLENARSYWNRGARYTLVSPHLGGIPDVANALHAIRRLVFEERRLTLADLLRILRADWAGHEDLRRHVQNAYDYFGNDSEPVDALAARIVDDYAAAVNAVHERFGVLRVPGVSTFGRQVKWRDHHGATAHGYRNGDILAGNLSPTPGTDAAGVTALIRSHCRADLAKLANGAALDVRLPPSAVSGPEGVDALVGLIRGFVALGGFFLQVDILDTAVLLDAQRHPERHRNLAVRVSGWSARFATLDPEWQRMVIERSDPGRTP